MLKASNLKVCPVCGKRKYSKKKDPVGNKWHQHVTACIRFNEKYAGGCACGKMPSDFRSNAGFASHFSRCKSAAVVKNLPTCNCGKTREDFSSPQAFGGHVSSCGIRKDSPAAVKVRSVKVAKPFRCPECSKSFATKRQLTAHSWIHNSEGWGDKDSVRQALQTIAASRIKRLPVKKRVAICLPGNRPDNETKLLADPGFHRIHMVECDRDKFLVGRDMGFDVEHGDFLEVMTRLVNEGTNFSLIDYDLCGTLTYADGSTILDAIRLGGLADIAAVRITCCRRNHKRDGQLDIAAFDRDVNHALPPGYSVTGRAWLNYVGKDRSSMATQQWLIEKGV